MITSVPIAENIREPHEATGGEATGWWGVVLLIIHEGLLFVALLSAYLYIQANAIQSPPDGIAPPEIELAAVGTIMLLMSSIVAYFAHFSIRRSYQGRGALLLLGTILLGSTFVAIQLFEYTRLPFLPQENAYTSLFYTIIGIHLLHVLIGLLMQVFVVLGIGTGVINTRRQGYIENATVFWHFVTVTWLVIFSVLYLSHALLLGQAA
jgi:heme/copper-type cytochrome/quinol oxidase subunit 3